MPTASPRLPREEPEQGAAGTLLGFVHGQAFIPSGQKQARVTHSHWKTGEGQEPRDGAARAGGEKELRAETACAGAAPRSCPQPPTFILGVEVSPVAEARKGAGNPSHPSWCHACCVPKLSREGMRRWGGADGAPQGLHRHLVLGAPPGPVLTAPEAQESSPACWTRRPALGLRGQTSHPLDVRPWTRRTGGAVTKARAAGGPPPGWDLQCPPPPAHQDAGTPSMRCHDPRPLQPHVTCVGGRLGGPRHRPGCLCGAFCGHPQQASRPPCRGHRGQQMPPTGIGTNLYRNTTPGQWSQGTGSPPTSMRPEPPTPPTGAHTPGTLPGSKQTLPLSPGLGAQRCPVLSCPPLPAARAPSQLPVWVSSWSETTSLDVGGGPPFRRSQEESAHCRATERATSRVSLSRDWTSKSR